MFEWITWENPVAIWWVSLSLASLVNIGFWFFTKIYLFKNQGLKRFSFFKWTDRNIIWFSGFYVFVCAFRSFLPRADVQRICLYDTWFSSVFIGRTVATVAELAFVIQWAIVIGYLSKQLNLKNSLRISKFIVPFIFIAEIFSWYAVVRTHYIGNMIEESIWGVTYLLITFALIEISIKFKGALLIAARFAILGGCLYVLFMFTVDVPMYYHRWQVDILNQKPLLNFWNGIIDLNTRWIVTRSISDWKSEIPWQTLYFTFAVLVSIALCYVPFTTERLKKYLKY